MQLHNEVFGSVEKSSLVGIESHVQIVRGSSILRKLLSRLHWEKKKYEFSYCFVDQQGLYFTQAVVALE